MLKVNYISFLHPSHFHGGGELVINALIKYGKEQLGIQVNFVTLKPKVYEYNHNADLNWFADIFNLPTSWRNQSKDQIRKMMRDKPFIHFDNAYVDTCNLDYLPCGGESSAQCPYKSEQPLMNKLKSLDFSDSCFAKTDLVKDLYSSSFLNVFVSPLHFKTTHKLQGLKEEKSFILRPVIDVQKFENKNQERDIEYLYVGAINKAKGVDNLKKYFQKGGPGFGKKLTMLGNNTTGEKWDFAEELGFIPYDEIPRYYNRAKRFVHLPIWPEPQGRTVVEAALCGCELITNENVGATSFDFDLSNPSNLQNVEQEFWDKINIVLEESKKND